MSVLAPNAQPPRYIVDPVAFFVALIAAPFVFALLTFWALLIPVAAIVFGGPFYLVIGTPVLLWVLSKRDPHIWEVAGWSLIAVLAIVAVTPLIAFAFPSIDAVEFAQFYGGFGLIFAPAWSALFLVLYRSLRRDFYARGRPFS